jgi:hypothetical protein
MKNSIAVARQTQAAELQAETVVALKEQLDRVEAMLGALLEALAHNAVQTTATPNLVSKSKASK